MAYEGQLVKNDVQGDGNGQEETSGLSHGSSCDENIHKSQVCSDTLSKNALKKLACREKWLAHRKRKRLEEKQRKKEKRAALKKAGLGQSLRRFRGKSMEQSTCKVRVVIDMSFDSVMSEKDCRRTVQQLNWCYSANRRLLEPFQFYITSFYGSCRKIYESIESNQNQDIFLKTESLDDLFKACDIVYLTADSENVLTDLDDSKVYVIGGLVDHNSEKGLCYQLAIRKGYGHARLPIDEYVQMKTRRVLTINHVFEILAHFSEHGDWEKAFFAVIPPRKEISKKNGLGIGSGMSGKCLESISEGQEVQHSQPSQ